MKFDISIWGEAAEVIRRNLTVFIVAFVTLWVVETAIFSFKPDAQAPAYLTFIVGVQLAIASHVTILRDVSGFKALTGIERKVSSRFWWRAAAIGILSFILSVVIALAIAINIPGVKELQEDGRIFLGVILCLLVYGVISLVILGLCGTWLPAAIAADGSSLKRAFARGWNTIGYTVFRLIIGPGANVVLFLASVFLLPAQFSEATRTYTFHIGKLQFIPFDIAINGFANVVWATGTVLVAVVLSRAYQLGEVRLAEINEQQGELTEAEAI